MAYPQSGQSSSRHGKLRCGTALVIWALLVPCLVQAQFIHIFEVDENRAPKTDRFDPSSYKYVSPAQLQKQQDANKRLEAAAAPSTPPPTTPRPRHQSASVPEYRATQPPSTTASRQSNDGRQSFSRADNAYNAHLAEQEGRQMTPLASAPPTQPPTTPVTYMQPISRILAFNNSANEIPAQSEMELRKQIRGIAQSENRYSRTTPLRVSAQNQRQYVVRVPAPFVPNQGSQSSMLPHEQLPPNLARHIQGSQFAPANQAGPSGPLAAQSSHRLSTLNTARATSSSEQGIPSSLLNSFLQRQQQPQSPAPTHHRQQPVAQPPYAANIPNYAVTPPARPSAQLQLQAPPQGHTLPASLSSAPTGRSIGGAGSNGGSISLQSVLQPPVTNKEHLTDDDIRLIEEHNRKVRLFLQQRQAELATEQERARNQKAAEEAAAARAQQEAANRAAEQERYQRLRAEQEAAAKAEAARAEAARAAAEQERHRRIKEEQEAAARAAAESERIRRIKEEQEAAARAAAEAERYRRYRAEQEAAARAAVEQERTRRIKAEHEAAARAAAEAERVRRIKAEQEAQARAEEEARMRRLHEEREAAARAAAEQERVARIRAHQEAAARAAAEAERNQRLRAEQEAIARAEAAARAAAEEDKIRRLRAEQEAAARAAAERAAAEQERAQKIKAEQDYLRRLRDEQEAAARAAAEQDQNRKLQEEQHRIQRLRAEQEAANAANQEQERYRQLRAQQEAASRLAEAERERLTNIRAEQEIAAIRARYANSNLRPIANVTSSNSNLSYQPEPNLALDEGMGGRYGQVDPSATGSVDSARYRAEKEALAEQERLLRFQASQQALAQQQVAEQAKLRRLREEEMVRAEEEQHARDSQERQILRARHDQNRAIQAARDAAIGDTQLSGRPPYTEDINRYPATNYTSINNQATRASGSLNNVRTPEPRLLRSSYRGSTTPREPLPISEAIPSISGDYVRRVVERPLSYANQTSSSSLSPNRISPSTPAALAPQPVSTPPSPPRTGNHRDARISLQELPPDLDKDGIPGTAGRDYPTLTSIPKTSFSCAQQPLNGYYADTETACQVVHMCQSGGVQDSFLCPNGTIWNQSKFACQWWYEVNCETAPTFYELNNKLYKMGPEANNNLENNAKGKA